MVTVGLLLFINCKLKKIVMKNEELAQGLTDLKTQLGKVNTEITGKIAALQAAIDGADNVPDAVVAAFNDLKPAVQQLDDIVPDPAPPIEEPAA